MPIFFPHLPSYGSYGRRYTYDSYDRQQSSYDIVDIYMVDMVVTIFQYGRYDTVVMVVDSRILVDRRKALFI